MPFLVRSWPGSRPPVSWQAITSGGNLGGISVKDTGLLNREVSKTSQRDSVRADHNKYRWRITVAAW